MPEQVLSTAAGSKCAHPRPSDRNVCAGKAEEGASSAADVQLRLPGEDWRERHGAAGVQADKRRNSPSWSSASCW